MYIGMLCLVVIFNFLRLGGEGNIPEITIGLKFGVGSREIMDGLRKGY